MDMTIKDQLRMARGQTRSNRKLTVTPLRCRDRRLVHRPLGQIHSEEEAEGHISYAICHMKYFIWHMAFFLTSFYTSTSTSVSSASSSFSLIRFNFMFNVWTRNPRSAAAFVWLLL